MDSKSELIKYSANKLKELRERKMSQQELAEELSRRLKKKVSRQSISRYENGERKINQDILFNLSEIFEVPISYFFPAVKNDDDTTNKIIYEDDNLICKIKLKKGKNEISNEEIKKVFEMIADYQKH